MKGPSSTLTILPAYISETIDDRDIKIWDNLDLRLEIVLFGIVQILTSSDSFFFDNFRKKGKVQVLRISLEKSGSDISESLLFLAKKSIYTNKFLGEKIK